MPSATRQFSTNSTLRRPEIALTIPAGEVVYEFASNSEIGLRKLILKKAAELRRDAGRAAPIVHQLLEIIRRGEDAHLLLEVLDQVDGDPDFEEDEREECDFREPDEDFEPDFDAEGEEGC